MKFICDYASLVSDLSDLAEVVEDGLVSEDLRNVIFKFTPESTELIGANQLITFKRTLKPENCRVFAEDADYKDGVRYIQFNSKELNNLLGSYKGVRRTSVEEVSFELQASNRVKCTVYEKDLETNDMRLSSWTLVDIPMKKNVLGLINISSPSTELQTVEARTILFYTKNMLPLLQTGTTLYSRLTFAEDYVISFTQKCVTFMRNMLPDAFKGILLTHRAVSFMGKVLCNADTVGVSRDDQYLYFETDNSRAFIRYDNRLPQYKMYLDSFKRDHAFSLDRIYLKDTLKRLKLSNELVELTVDTEKSEIVLKNTSFIQSLDLLQTKALDECGNIRFKVMPDVIADTILGSDDEFSQNLFVYYCPQHNKVAIVVFTDDSGSWFSCITVKPY